MHTQGGSGSARSNGGASVCALVFCGVATYCAAGQAPQAPSTPAPTFAFHEEVMAEMSPGSEYKKAFIGDSHLAWAESQGGIVTVRLDGKQQGQGYKEVSHLNFNADESHFVFFGMRTNSLWVFVMDGQEKPQEYKEVTAIVFQPNGSSYAYGACQEKKKCKLVVDGTETGAEYQNISFPRYSRDGKRLAYMGKKEKKWIAVVDGKEFGPEIDDFWGSLWGFTHDGTRFFAAGENKGDWFYVLDGQAGPSFGVISPIHFSSDGQHYTYGGASAKLGLKKQKTTGSIVVDGQTATSYEGKGMSGALAQGFGRYTETLASGVRDFSPDFHGVSSPWFNAEGKLVYAARRDKGDVAVFVGSDAGPGFDEILSFVAFSDDSKHFAYVARREKEFVEVRDNAPGKPFSSTRHEASDVPWIAINDDATHLAYETVSGGNQFKAGQTSRALRSVVLDGQQGPEYDALNLRNFHFLEDGKHYFYEVIGAKGNKDLVNVDGHESQLYDFVISSRFVPHSKTMSFVARSGQKFLLVSAILE
jgi:hypothetical protein